MPITPFHFGPGLALKGIAAPMFSWSAFAVAQVVIDCETIYYLVNGEYPVHRFFHSFLGATAAGLIAAVLFLVGIHASFLAFPRAIVPLTAASTTRGEISVLGVLMGGLVGGLSHPLLDGIMHPDVRPFMPWTDYNPFLGLIGLAPLHLACIASAVLGAVGVALWKRRRKGEVDMIEHRLDTAHSILFVRPKSALQQDDFVQLAKTVDPFIEKTGDLAGLVIETPAFPGWDSLGAMGAHFRFVRDHHKRIKKVAVVTDAALGNLVEKLASHFVSAKIRHFAAGEVEAARRWIMS